MVQNLKQLFFENPIKEFYLRQMSRITDIPKTTVARRLKELLNKDLIVKVESEPYDKYRANEQSRLYTFYKKFFILEKIHKSGLIEYIEEEISPKAIVLFGSCAKGEYDKDSDIDLCIIGKEKELNLEQFDINHRFQLFFFSKLSEIPRNLRHNIINGIVLYGFLK